MLTTFELNVFGQKLENGGDSDDEVKKGDKPLEDEMEEDVESSDGEFVAGNVINRTVISLKGIYFKTDWDWYTN